jgi:cytoskeletal protein CcmA (bactofilin family)
VTQELEGSAVACAVGAGARFEGLLSFWGAARVDGALRGEVAARGRLEVGPAAQIAARIQVDALVVEGAVEGEIVARQRVEVRSGARVRASIRTPRLSIDEGALFEGSLAMGEPGAGPEAAASAA